LRLQELTHQLEVLGDPVDDKKVILKFLRVVPKKYKQMARSIESLLDLKTMSIEELTSRLKICEEDDVEDEPAGARGGGQLLLTEEQWRTRMKGQESGGSSGGAGSKNRRNKGRETHDKGQAGNNAGGAARDD
jgi:hypothetical protein